MAITILQGDCRDMLPTLEAGSVHCCVTSPPYWGSRDYGLEPSVWGGDPGCEHDWATIARTGGGKQNEQGKRWQHTDSGVSGHGKAESSFCNRCGAWRGSFGLEPTPDLYIEHAVEVFRHVRRVLRDDGTLWVNIGDSYASDGGKCFNPGGGELSLGKDRKEAGAHPLTRPNKSDLKRMSLKAKDLVGVPWMLAFALRADGWWLRQDIIWSKPNPMPESTEDRCTKAHEYVFLLAKSERYYHRELLEPGEGHGSGNKTKRWGNNHTTERGKGTGAIERQSSIPWEGKPDRKVRSVWTVPVKPYKQAHFATFPPKLIEPCILAGCPEGGTVLDPFLGSGTTAQVADKLGCHCVGIELNPAYVRLCRRRVAQRSLLTA